MPLLCGLDAARGIVAREALKEKTMPKIKTRRAAAKRFSVTGTGKFKRRRQNLRHILTKKNAKRKMRLGQATLVDSTNEKAVRRMLPNV